MTGAIKPGARLFDKVVARLCLLQAATAPVVRRCHGDAAVTGTATRVGEPAE
jgi:hypothetical protein